MIDLDTLGRIILRQVETGATSISSSAGEFNAVHVPTTGNVVYAENGLVRSFSAGTGRQQWKQDLGGSVPFLYSGLKEIYRRGNSVLLLYGRGLVQLAADSGDVTLRLPLRQSVDKIVQESGERVVVSANDDVTYLGVDLDAGKVVWRSSFHLATEYSNKPELLTATDEYFYGFSSDPRLRRIHLRNGNMDTLRMPGQSPDGVDEPVPDDGEPDELEAAVHPSGYGMMWAGGEWIKGFDFNSGRRLWKAKVEGMWRDQPAGNTADGQPVFHLGYRKYVNAASGHPLPEDVETVALPGPRAPESGGNVNVDNDSDSVVSAIDTPAGGRGPDGIGTVSLTVVEAPASAIALACAPDGLGASRPDAPAPGIPCEKPRIYAFNLGA